MVANTLHISNKAKATAKTAPMTLTITAMAFISDGQSTMEMQQKHFSHSQGLQGITLTFMCNDLSNFTE